LRQFVFPLILTPVYQLPKPIALSSPEYFLAAIFACLFIFDEFNKQRIKNKVILKLIFKKEPSNFDELNNLLLTEAKFSGLSYTSLTIIIILDDEILMVVPMNPFSIISIKSKDIAESYREYFSVLWMHSQK